MNTQRNIGKFLSIALFGAAIGSAKRYWKDSTPRERIFLAIVILFAGLISVAVFLR